MNRIVARLLTRLYPDSWRSRYGAEFEIFLEDIHGGLRTLANVAWSAFCERFFPTQGGNMNHNPNSFGAIVKRPSAFLPMVMSLTALAVLGIAAMSGALVPRADEGATAHIWQLLMAGQMPLLAFFAIKWLPRAPMPTVYVLALQAGAALAAMAPVFLLHL